MAKFKLNNYNITDKAWQTWNEIAYRWFDYDACQYVTNKAYNLHLEIEYILKGI